MNDSMRVQVLQGVNDLLGVAFNLQLVQPLSTFEQLIHTLVLAQLQQDINIFTVLKKVKKLSHICMLHRPVNFDLTHQFLFSPAPL